MSMKAEVVVNAPPAVVAGWSLMGHSLPEWAAAVTIAYTGVLLLRLTIRWLRNWRTTGDFFNVD